MSKTIRFQCDVSMVCGEVRLNFDVSNCDEATWALKREKVFATVEKTIVQQIQFLAEQRAVQAKAV
jgi:hypothetical protein